MKQTNWKFRTGLILMIISIPLFLAVPVIPFVGFGPKTKVVLVPVLIISAELLFWSGGLLLGKELFLKYKSKLNPRSWFGRKRSRSENNTEN